MKRLLRSLLLGAILSALLCVGALAADTNDPGIYNIKTNDGVTITPKKADNSAITDVGGYYANAVKFDVTASGLTGEENAQCLLLVLKGDASGNAPTTPTADNIVYINQAEKGANGKASFTGTDAAYPKELRTGTYYVYLVSERSEFKADAPAATFQYDQKYTLGDVNDDTYIDSRDALLTLRYSVNLVNLSEIQQLAADVNRDGYIDSRDALLILRYSVNLIDHF